MEEKLAGMLLMDIKGAFIYVSTNSLIQNMDVLEAERNFFRWTG